MAKELTEIGLDAVSIALPSVVVAEDEHCEICDLTVDADFE